MRYRAGAAALGLALTLAAAFMLQPAAVTASSGGASPGMTGGFGEPTCQRCHAENPLNSPPGALRLTGVPRTYTPGARYVVTVALKRPTMGGAGFQIAARYVDGPSAGRPAGRFRSLDNRVQVVEHQGRRQMYVQQTKAGTTLVRGEGRWTVEWTAPAEASGGVVLHAAGNAANGDASMLGDFIYTATAQVAPARPATRRSTRVR